MTKRLNDEAFMDAREAARMRADAKTEARMERREREARTMIGELCRDGKTVHYVFPVGGRYREGTTLDLIGFLIRNNYA